jgi:serine/threonine-protein kinase
VSRIYMRTLREFDARPLPGTEGAVGPFFSPDGAWVGFFANRSLKKTPADGGVVVTIVAGASVRGAVWTDADTIIYADNGTSGLNSVPASGGQPHRVTTVDPQQKERTHRLPSILPDGKTVLFNVGTLASPEVYDDATIEAVRVDTGQRTVVLRGGRMPVYSATGDLLYVRGNVLYAVSFDPRRLEVRGRARPIIDGILGDPTAGTAFYAVSNSGILTYVPGNPSSASRRLAWANPDGKITPIDLPAALYTENHVSPDGMRLAFSVIVEGSRDRDVWVADLNRGASRRLTSQGTNWTPIWSPDGRRVFFVSYDGEKNQSSFQLLAADGGPDVARFGTFDGTAFLSDISSDGATLFLRGRPANETRWHLYRLATTGDARVIEIPAPLLSNAWDINISPNGQWFAYGAGTEGHDLELLVQSVDPGGGRVQLSANGREPHWSPDGRDIYFVQNDRLHVVSVGEGATLTPGRPRQLPIETLPSSIESAQTYDVDHKTGRLLIMQAMSDRPAAPKVRFLLNGYTDIGRGER